MTICAGIDCINMLPPSVGHRPRKWCSERCRKRSYGDPCIECGARTGFGAEMRRVAEPRCASCASAHRTKWTAQTITAAMREWASIEGTPPAMSDWRPWTARNRLNDEKRAARFGRNRGRWPSTTRVLQVFATWNAALEAAGFTSRRAGGFSENQERRRARAAA